MPEPVRPFCLPGPAVMGCRIVVLGSTCSGKTTLAGKLAGWLGLPHIELDALHWGPDWTPTPRDEFRAQVLQAVSAPGWVVDGNYRSMREVVWPRVDTFIWLDYPLPIILFRLLKRSIQRVVTQEVLWNGNRENVSGAFFSKDSLFLWALSHHSRYRPEYQQIFNGPTYQHTTRVVLSNPRVTERFCAAIRAQAHSPQNQQIGNREIL